MDVICNKVNCQNDCASTDRVKLLNKIREVGFAVVELNLFLDTHPYDRGALTMFKRLCEKKQMLTEEYTRKYGPLKACDSSENVPFDWVSEANKWPWEKECEI